MPVLREGAKVGLENVQHLRCVQHTGVVYCVMYLACKAARKDSVYRVGCAASKEVRNGNICCVMYTASKAAVGVEHD